MKGQEEKWDWNPNLYLSLRLPKGGLFWLVFLFPTQRTCKVYFKIEFLEDSEWFKPRSLEETSALTLHFPLSSCDTEEAAGMSILPLSWMSISRVHALVVVWFGSLWSNSDSIICTQFLRTRGSHWPHAQNPGSRDTGKRWDFLEVRHTKVSLSFTWECKVPTAELALTNIWVL